MTDINALYDAPPSPIFPEAPSEVRANLLTNPSIEVDTVGWAVLPTSTLARSSTRAAVGTWSLLLTAVNSTAAAQQRGAISSGMTIPVTPGLAYALSASFYNAGTANDVRIRPRFLDAALTALTAQTPVTDATKNAWVRLGGVWVAPATAAFIQFEIYAESSATGQTYSVSADAFLLEKALAVGGYFDGTYSDAYWGGTPHASASYLYSPPQQVYDPPPDMVFAPGLVLDSKTVAPHVLVGNRPLFPEGLVGGQPGTPSFDDFPRTLFDDPVNSSDAGGATAIGRDTALVSLVNLVTNPSFEASVVGWRENESNTEAGITREKVNVVHGEWAGRVTRTTGTGTRFPGFRLFPRINATAGRRYRCMGEVTVTTFPTGADGTVMLMRWYDAAEVLIGISTDITVTIPGTVPGRKSFNFSGIAPPGTARCEIIVYLKSTAASPADLHLDRVAVYESEIDHGYFDGDTPGFRWTGTPHLSSSERVPRVLVFEEDPDRGGQVGDYVASEDFFRIGSPTFIKTAARIFVADPLVAARPISVSDVLVTAPGSTQFDVRSDLGWSELGVTKGGITIQRNVGEDVQDIDVGSGGLVTTQKVMQDVTIETRLADMSLAKLAQVWDNVISNPSAFESRLGGGVFPVSFYRRVVVAHPIRADSGGKITKIRAYVFNTAEWAGTDQQYGFQKTGDPQTIPVKFRALGDPAEPDLRQRFFYVLERTI